VNSVATSLRHDPDADCDCTPNAPAGEPVCEYRILADVVGGLLNPPDYDASELSLLETAVERIAAYVKSLPCFCGPGAAAYEADPCGRCRALGQRCGKPESR
jgi:hypothetical protein